MVETKIRRYLTFASRAEAVSFSASLMSAEQSPETRADPDTVTRFKFLVNQNRSTGRAALLVPNDEDELALPAAQRDALVTEREALEGGYIDLDARAEPDDREPVGGTGGGRVT